MSDRRALLTDREREIISKEADVSDSYRYQTISRVRSRFDRLEDDLEAFEKHGDLLIELQKIVCEDAEAEDIAMSGSSDEILEDSPQPDQDVDVDQEKELAEATAEIEAEGERDVLVEDVLRDCVADVEFPSTKDREECLEAIRAAYEYLQDHGEATMSEFVREVMPEHPVGYDADADVEKINDPDKRNRSTWWRRVVKPGLQALPDVESPPKGASNWKYTGETDE